MTTDLCSDDVVVCITAPQILTSESIVSGGGSTPLGTRVATSTATVELGRRLLLAARAGDTPRVLDLMAKGAPFTTDWLGTSPLHLAASNAHVETCAVLLRAGFSRDARTKVQRTPLHLAAYGGHASVTKLLLDTGAAVDCRDMLRMTPLHWAVQRGHLKTAAELLRRGADPNAVSKFHKSPVTIAAEMGREDILKLIEDAIKEREAAKSVDALVNEQMAESPAADPQLQMFDTVQRLEDIKQVKTKQLEKKTKVDLTHTDTSNLKRDDIIKLIEDAIKDRGTKSVDTAYSIVTEQIESPTVESHMQGFDAVQRIQEVKPNILKQEKKESHVEKTISSVGEGAGAALLRSHGITLLPPDHSSTVLNALHSGRTVVLSDAGKLMLKESGEQPPVSKSSSASQGKGMVLTATPVKSPPKPGVKIFTLNNKLLAVPKEAKIPVKKIINPHDTQVKFIHLSADAKVMSPSMLVPMKSKTKLARTAITSPAASARPAVKIIMNKSNFNKLIANNTKANVVHNGIEVQLAEPATSRHERRQLEHSPILVQTTPTTTATVESTDGADAAGAAEAESSARLRAQLHAARRALASLRAELHACKARLALYETV